MPATSVSATVQHLYTEHHSWLRAWLVRRLGNEFDAADLAHDTYVRVLRRSEPSVSIREPRAYLTTIANGLVVSHFRRQSLEIAYLEALAVLPEPLAMSAEQQTIILQTLHEVDNMLNALKPRVRQAFLLAQVDGLKQQEIACALNVTVPTVKKYMQQAWLACLCMMTDD